MPADEQVVTLPMDNGWTKAVKVGKLPAGDARPVIVDMDPAADPVLMSQPFPVRTYKRIAVKVVDVYGNESTVVKEIG